MNLFSFLALLVLALVAAAAEPPTELQIETTYKPDDCPVTATKGDRIRVHYVSRHTGLAIASVVILGGSNEICMMRRLGRCSLMATSSTLGE